MISSTQVHAYGRGNPIGLSRRLLDIVTIVGGSIVLTRTILVSSNSFCTFIMVSACLGSWYLDKYWVKVPSSFPFWAGGSPPAAA